MSANVTWGVTSASTAAYLAQYVHDDDAYPVDTDDFPVLLAQAASTVNGYVLGAGFTLTAISDDATTVAYVRCQGWTTRLTAAAVLRSSVGADPELSDKLEGAVMKELGLLLKNPKILGAGVDEGGVRGGVSTPVSRLSLDTGEAARRERRHYDTVKGRTGGLLDDIHGW